MSNNPKTAAWYGNDIGHILVPGAGDIFYVNGVTGVDTNDGLTPDTPVLTITYALTDLVTAGADDYIIVLDYADPPSVTETFPIACNVNDVHIIGMGVFNMNRTPIWPAGATAAFEITDHDVEIAGFDLAAGAASACIENGDTVWRAWIHDNEFGRIHGCQDGIGIGLGAVDCPHWLIENNTFGHLNTLTRDGIRIEQNSTRSVIRNNLFYVDTGTVGIHLQGLCTAIGYIMDNRFKVADAQAGEAVYVENVNASVCQFHNNMVASGNVAMTFNPYRDLGAACHWGVNYAGTAPVYPVTV